MLLYLVYMVSLWSLLVGALPQLPHNPQDFRANTTAHLIFNSVSGLLQHWPNTIYRNGHTFVPSTVPAGALLYHSRPSFEPPPSPEFFAFDVDHSYIFCARSPCVMYTYVPKRDLKLGYFDGTSAATLEGPRDLQDIAFNDHFITKDEYDPWVHGINMCKWAKRVGLDGIVRMEPSFEAILCNINSDLQLVSSRELVYHQTMIFPGQHLPGKPNTTSTSAADAHIHPRLERDTPYFPGPTIPVYPPPPGWQGIQRTFADTAFESIRAGMWHNHFPGESRIILDYSSIVSAYDGVYTSLAHGRQGVPRSKHRLNNISTSNMSRLKAEMEEVLKTGRPAAAVNWRSVFQDTVNRYGERLEDLRYLLRRSDLKAEEIVAKARQKVLVMLTPYMCLPRSKPNGAQANSMDRQQPLDVNSHSARQNTPDDDWFTRIYDSCAKHPTIEFARGRKLTTQEEKLANSIDVVHGAICSSLTTIWATAFDSGDKPLIAKYMIAEWKTEIEELMEWLDWAVWIKCDPLCGPGFQCVLATWPWEVQTGDENIGPMCRDHMNHDDTY
ncbi:unnamed protein product [Rhizoctonia solani]|uniref:Uncharacterized protein n=1 Tax=Rhizoctonia solani TaxID=456999 RepID=A0A8H3DH68_9AGAM|nr:unnamed protein product [Rhizoctonia solani]